MDSLSNDIIKYKKGELSPEQMHVLEKKALVDPFLAEALEGIENISAVELANDISAIEKKILNNKKEAILFTPLRIAAGIIIVAASIFLIYQFVPKTETLALRTEKKIKNEGSEKPSTGSEKEVKKIESKKLKVESEERRVKKPEPVIPRKQNPETSLDNHQYHQPASIATETEKPVAADEVQPLIQQAPVQVLAEEKEQSEKIENADDQLSKEIVTLEQSGAGVKAISTDKKKDSFAASDVQRSASPKKNKATQSISGQVISAEDGSPLPGVIVTLKGTSTSTATDLNGNYTIPAEAENRSLVFSFIGLQQEEVDASDKSEIDIQMKEDATQLSEMVVTGFGLAKDENREPIIRWAEPVGGKKAYNNYLESNLKYPEEALANKIKGKAGIEFTVNVDGSLQDFQVIKKLGYGCEEEIIRLVKEGPKWTPSTEDSKPFESTVRIRLRFDPAKSGK